MRRSTPSPSQTHRWTPLLLSAVLVLGLALPRPAQAREASFRRVSDYVWFLLGAGAGLALHEGSHLMFNGMLDTRPELRAVSLGPFPFFAIQPTQIKNNQHRYVIAMAGFLMQDLYSEVILQADPELRAHHRPFLKGMLAFHVALSLGYAITGFANIGPAQSDVNTMSRALNTPPWAVGLLLIAPVVTDTYRYFVPHSRWAPWVSLASKSSLVGIALTL